MKSNNIAIDPWKIIEEKFDKSRMRASESLFSIGNGRMGGRANFEEYYSGSTLQGNYIGGVYYPDKTRVGWWKNGYPEYFAKVLNSAFWIGVDVVVDGVRVDLATSQVESFCRELDMKEGTLRRHAVLTLENGVRIEIETCRFVSMKRTELGVVSYSVTPLDSDATVEFTPYIDADVKNEDANYNEKFWELVSQTADSVTMRTRKTGYEVCWCQRVELDKDTSWSDCSSAERVACCATIRVAKSEKITFHKYVGVTSTLSHDAECLTRLARRVSTQAAQVGFCALLDEHRLTWGDLWSRSDIEIEGDTTAQQGIRYCIFQLLQTYTGEDNRLNIGPKGFTGEKYGGSTYWDTEAYCLTFYMATAGEDVARQLLMYRYNQLDKAIENAEKLGFSGGAALYPMVTMNGEECHNEWEITFEEIHRNGAIAYAIRKYIDYTGDRSYLASGGLEVLLSIARFWAQRITYSQERGKYVMLGVTGPNEYENNVNNNWYTNYIALWCMRYAAESAQWVRENHPDDYDRIVAKRNFKATDEVARWADISANMHLPYSENLNVFLQQDGYLDKEQILASELNPSERPINQKWSWDRILRSCFIKQADVLQGLYFFESDFDTETIRRNFYFYEPRTVHESSLSPCVHAIVAAKIGDLPKAYEMYLRASRLDLDDYNHENEEGLHITSMAGSWLSVIEGFAGMRISEQGLTFAPLLPEGWSSLSFRIRHQGRQMKVVLKHGVEPEILICE